MYMIRPPCLKHQRIFSRITTFSSSPPPFHRCRWDGAPPPSLTGAVLGRCRPRVLASQHQEEADGFPQVEVAAAG